MSTALLDIQPVPLVSAAQRLNVRVGALRPDHYVCAGCGYGMGPWVQAYGLVLRRGVSGRSNRNATPAFCQGCAQIIAADLSALAGTEPTIMAPGWVLGDAACRAMWAHSVSWREQARRCADLDLQLTLAGEARACCPGGTP